MASQMAAAYGFAPGAMPPQCLAGMMQAFPGYDPNALAQYSQYSGFAGCSGYGMYPGMNPMYSGYSMYGQAYPQAGAFAQGQLGALGGVAGACGAAGCAAGGHAAGTTPAADARDGVAASKSMMPGDWMCPRCGDHVFARNPACRRCATPKPDGASLVPACAAGGCIAGGGLGLGGGGGGANQRALPGDWHCPKCKDLQFARNKQCRMCGCPKPESGGFDLRDGARLPSRRSRSRSHSRRRSRSRGGRG